MALTKLSPEKPFLSDVQNLRRRAREHIYRGAVTPSYQGDIKQAVRILNEALATEWVCVLRYKSHFFMATGIQAESVAEEFRRHAAEEMTHADQIAARIRQLGGCPDFNPATLLIRSHAEYQVGETLAELIVEDLVAERVAIESYREMICYFGDNDPTTRRLLEEILAKEEEHAEELSDLLLTFDPNQKARNTD